MGNQPSSSVFASDKPISSRLGSTNAIPSPGRPLASNPHTTSPETVNIGSKDLLSRTLDRVVPDPSSQPLCMLTSSDTALDAILTFHRHNISSIPIRLEQPGRFALLDQADLMALFCQAHAAHGQAAWQAEQLTHLLRTPCGSLANLSLMNPTLTVPLSATVAETLRKVSIERAHRLLVLDSDSELYQIVSQTQMLRYLLPALPFLLPHELASRSLASLNWTGGPPPIRFVQSDASVASAVHLCLQHRIHRIPVMFPADTSCSSSSSSSLFKPRLGVFGAWDLTRTLVVPGKFTTTQLTPSQRNSLSSLTSNASPSPSSLPLPPWSPGPASLPAARVGDVCERACCVDISDSLAKVIELLATRAREVIIADDVGHPVHIITQGDCLRYLMTLIQASVGQPTISCTTSVDDD